MKVRVLHHNHCFDGLASAAVFSRFYRERLCDEVEIDYTGLAHTPNQRVIEEELFDGEVNAIEAARPWSAWADEQNARAC